MWVVFNIDTGWSNEDMRFATKGEAQDWIDEQNPELDTFDMRYEP